MCLLKLGLPETPENQEIPLEIVRLTILLIASLLPRQHSHWSQAAIDSISGKVVRISHATDFSRVQALLDMAEAAAHEQICFRGVPKLEIMIQEFPDWFDLFFLFFRKSFHIS